MAVTPSLGMYRLHIQTLWSAGWIWGLSHATVKRRLAASLVNRAATSGRAALRALPSSLEVVTVFQVILYSPARSSSDSPMWALRASLIASASACASSIRACSFPQLLDLVGQFDCTHVLFLLIVGPAVGGIAAVSLWSVPHPVRLLRSVLGVRLRCPFLWSYYITISSYCLLAD